MSGKGLRLRRSISRKNCRDRFTDRHGHLRSSFHFVYVFPKPIVDTSLQKSFPRSLQRKSNNSSRPKFFAKITVSVSSPRHEHSRRRYREARRKFWLGNGWGHDGGGKRHR